MFIFLEGFFFVKSWKIGLKLKNQSKSKIDKWIFLDFFSVSLVKMIRNDPLDFQNGENWFLVHSRWLKLGYGPKIGQKWAKNGYFQNFEKTFKNYRYCLKETWKVLYWAKIPAQSKKLDITCPEPFGGKSGGWVLLYHIVQGYEKPISCKNWCVLYWIIS